MSSKWLTRLRSLLLFWGGAFFLASLVFLFRAEEILLSLNGLGEFLQLPLEPISVPSESLSWVFLLTLLATLIYACFYASADLGRRLDFVHLVLLVVFVAGGLFLVVFLIHSHALAYLAGCLLAVIVFVSTYLPYARIRRERRLMGIQ